MVKKHKNKKKVGIFVRKTNKKVDKSNKDVPSTKDILMQLILTAVIFTVLFGGYGMIQGKIDDGKNLEVSLSELVLNIKSGEISKITVFGNDIKAEYKSDDKIIKSTKKEADSSLIETLINYGVTPEQLTNIDIDLQNPTGFKYWFGQVAPLVIPALLIFGIIIYMSRQMGKGGGAMQAFSFGNSKARLRNPDDKEGRVTFKDVAGVKEAKAELMEVVDFLKNPKKFIKIGAQIPKGLILMGAPGCGKTLLARAVAGEAGVPFYSISGSEFVDMFVGVGASRTRDLFAQAKKNSPSIIFIDEIDAVGRVRGSGHGGGNDEREQTLNQILVEMDGFEPNEKVIVVAATNRPDVLDPALLRPGRFDRRVVVELPDKDAREEILKLHMKKKKTESDVDIKVVSGRTPGFSGADLSNLANEAAIFAVTNKRKKVSQADLLGSIEKVLIGPERKSHVLNKKEKEITAYHEAGHALVASMLPYADPIHKISIISRGRAAGYTLKLPDEDKKMHSKREFEADIAMSLGGFIAEREIFGDTTTGPSNDLQVLTNTARNMVTRWGMSDAVGPIALVGDGGEVLFGMGPQAKEYSEEMGTKIDTEVKKIIDKAYNIADTILREKRDALHAIAKKLIEVENLERAEYEELLKEHGIDVKSKVDIKHSPASV
ncbi:MAG: ATP-dependent zinc metalloprotease FtsH [Candidatus Pacebacteria bacterium]|nr:ATP-dependent zinc metalloprotease FtsH [Candidatus Paceibacterota bacterium]